MFISDDELKDDSDMRGAIRSYMHRELGVWLPSKDHPAFWRQFRRALEGLADYEAKELVILLEHGLQ